MDTLTDIRVVNGWCCRWWVCGGIGVECVRAVGHPELCTACLARDLGLAEGSAAGNVVAELMRRENP